MVAVQTALALTLLCAGALFGRTVQRLATVDPGYQTAGVLMGRIEPVAAGYDRDKRHLSDSHRCARPSAQAAMWADRPADSSRFDKPGLSAGRP